VGLFNWAAPLVHRYADRWTPQDTDALASWLRPFLSAECPEACRILDVGGGGGVLATHLNALLAAEVTVLDPSPEMLRYIPDAGPVCGILGSAEAMPFDADSFDAVVVTDAFHHFRDQSAALDEFRRVIREGGGVIVLDLDPRPIFMRLVRLAEMAVGEPGAFHTPEQLCALMAAHGIEGECVPEAGAGYRFVGTVRAETRATRPQLLQR
jgi:SAM-dependent methyltransferase